MQTGIPNNILKPGYWAKIDALAGGQPVDDPVLLIAQRLPSGDTAAATEVTVFSAEQAASRFGYGSMAHLDAVEYFKNDRNSSLNMICANDDASSGVRATKTIVYSGTATESRTLAAYVSDIPVPVAVSSGDTAAEIAAAVAAEICADLGAELSSGNLEIGMPYEITAQDALDFTSDGAPESAVGTRFVATSATLTLTAADKVRPILTALPVIANVLSTAPAEVVYTAKHAGELGNDIYIGHNQDGPTFGEITPAGVVISGDGYLASGDNNPDLTAIFAAIEPNDYFMIISPYTDSASLADYKADMISRWDYTRKNHCHVVSARRGSVGQQTTFADSVNDVHLTVYDTDSSPTPTDRIAAAVGAAAKVRLMIHPCLGHQTVVVQGVKGRAATAKRSFAESNALLLAGIATLQLARSGSVLIERSVTTGTLTDTGEPTIRWRDMQKPYALRFAEAYKQAALNAKFSDRLLKDDPTEILAGSLAITTEDFDTEIERIYSDLVDLDVCENKAAFAENLSSWRNLSDETRIDTIQVPDFTNPLINIAALIRFI